MSFSFNDLNLGGIELSSASNILQPGRYVCVAKHAKLKNSKSGGTMVEVEFEDVVSGASIRGFINVDVPKSDMATRIGREQLKALLTHGGHKDPDNVGKSGIASINGLKVGVLVVQESYEKDGQSRTGSQVKGFFDPKGFQTETSSSSKAASAPPIPDDEIPF
tara:strand:+ start:4683 stop:5171 length:489 start_codon:yes stop_codon:yes gene_type:complete